MTPEYYRTLYDYNAWANRRVLDACAGLTAEQFTKDLGSSFPTIRDTLTHIVWGQWLWLERWNGRSHGPERPWPEFADVASLRRECEKLDQDLVRYVAGLKGADLERVLDYKTSAGKPGSNPLWQMLSHLANHSTYHRGQVTTLLRQIGANAISTDLIAFFREVSARASA